MPDGLQTAGFPPSFSTHCVERVHSGSAPAPSADDAISHARTFLNPSLLRLTTPKFSDNDGEFDLHLPAGTAAKFQDRFP